MPGRSADRKIWAIGLVAVLVLAAAAVLGNRLRDGAGSNQNENGDQ